MWGSLGCVTILLSPLPNCKTSQAHVPPFKHSLIGFRLFALVAQSTKLPIDKPTMVLPKQLLAAIELALLGPSPLSSSQRMELVHAICSSLFSVHNPDRAAFSHYDNTLQLIYSSSQVRFMFIPAGKIEAGQTQFMASTFAAQLFPVFDHNRASEMVQNSLGPTFGDGLSGLSGTDAGPVGSTMQIESRLEKGGWIRVVHFLTHHVETKSRCEVYIAVSDGSALAFHC